jgi:polynucleotide 5'-hydroxyl-kinase GRC3/NOL9
VTRPITDLFNLQARNAVFIGVTSPSEVTGKVIESLSLLKKEIGNNPDFIIVDSDGWIEGEDAVRYKVRLVEEIKPITIFILQQKDEIAPLQNALDAYATVQVESPSVISQRSRERRKNLRELGYVKYLRNAKIVSFPLGWLKVEDNELFGLNKARISVKEAMRIYDLLGMKPLHFAEQDDRVIIIIGKRRWIDPDNLKRIEQTAKKKVVIMRKGEEEGLLTALYNAGREFLGIGLLQEIDFLRKTIKILTPVPENIAIATIGKVKLDKNMKELPAFGEETQSEATAFSKLV